MTWKQERYYSGTPLIADPNKPLPGEVPPGRKVLFVRIGIAIVLVSFGVMLGVALSPETPAQMQAKVTSLQAQLKASEAEVAALEQALANKSVEASAHEGALSPQDRARHIIEGRKYAQALRRKRHQLAAELIEWFIGRWNRLLENPQPDDRVSRRAAALSLLVGGMAKNLNPGDYVPWQAEFLHEANWLAELHLDADGDGLPGKRSRPNPKDGFANVSVCHIAMALNQAVTDAQLLVMPDMVCDRPEHRISVFLQGSTLDDAIDEFVSTLRQLGYLVREKNKNGIRIVLIGRGRRR